ncbi:MAG: hypothetical protein M1833_007117 [Piccolia ochrophora]|nr:MAG: hypothetical protein M1833_007117 [Piccolia ochrophora]
MAMANIYESQLCATGTVGVAAMGYVFGRPQQPVGSSPPPSKRKGDAGDLEIEELGPPTFSSPIGTRSDRSDDEPPKFPKRRVVSETRKRSTSNAGIIDTVGETNTGEVSPREHLDHLEEAIRAEHDPAASNSRRPGTSRNALVQRLSTLSTSQNPSPTSSPGPDSTSVTFSHGSSAPILHGSSRHIASPLPPNKLVKRSSSQRALGSSFATPPSGKTSRVPTLRRPATSHQRSATLQYQFAVGEDVEQVPQTTRSTSSPVSFDRSYQALPQERATTWRQFFEPRHVKRFREGQLARRHTPSRQLDLTIKQIYPENLHRPTLLKPESINNSVNDHFPSNVAFPRDGDTFIFGSSRPNTPSRLSAFFSPSSEGRSTPSDTAEPARPPRRSFSISDMFGSSPSSWLSRTRHDRATPRGKNGHEQERRYSSAPLSSIPRRLTVSAHGARQKKRNITDPAIFQAEDSPSQLKRPADSSSPLGRATPHDSLTPQARSPLTLHPVNRKHHTRVDAEATLALSPLGSSQGRARYSIAASTLVGSETEQRGSSVDDTPDLDFQSDTLFDSMRTGATDSSSGARGTSVESIFDKVQPLDSMAVKTALPHRSYSTTVRAGESTQCTHDIPEEEENISTPRKFELRLPETRDATPSRMEHYISASTERGSSPPLAERQRTAVESNYLGMDAQRDDIRWSFDDDEYDVDEDWCRLEDDNEIANQLSSPQYPRRFPLISPVVDPARLKLGQTESDAKVKDHSNRESLTGLFNWAEAPSINNSKSQLIEARPKTVSGKQNIESRGGRSTGRHGPNVQHVRSQSVPVTPDANKTQDGVTGAARYGTWGMGSKGVPEDWNEDFEFEGHDTEANLDPEEEPDVNPVQRSSMVVPEAIQERQASVIGHLSHVKEFALLVEDLKRLRSLAISKDIIDGSAADLWDEAEGIIDLATLDDDSQELPPPQSPSSTAPAFDNFDDEPGSVVSNSRSRRKSVLSIEDDIFGGGAASPSQPDRFAEPDSKTSTPSSRLSTKGERLGSSAVARSVIETIHQRRISSDPVFTPGEVSSQSKMPFDTTTLRDLVTHVSGLSRRLAEVVRDTESGPPSRVQSFKLSPTPSVGQVLADSVTSSPSAGKSRLRRGKSNNGVVSPSISAKDNDIGGHMPMMTVV